MNAKERGVLAATQVCRYNTSCKNPVNEWWKEQIGENECLTHLADARIFPCRVKTQKDLYRCSDFKTHKGKGLNPEKRFQK